jgi:hypothetical protein
MKGEKEVEQMTIKEKERFFNVKISNGQGSKNLVIGYNLGRRKNEQG